MPVNDSQLDRALRHLQNQPKIEPLNLPERLKFLSINDEDAVRVQAMLPTLHDAGRQFVEAFYKHLFSFDATARFLQDPKLVARLKDAQSAHLESMLAAQWDERYTEQRRRVGDTHADVGIEPQYFLGAYSQYLQFCFGTLADQHVGSCQALADQLLSLIKVVILDIGLTLDAYFAHSTSSLRSALEMLWKANAELRQFAQLTSHDLKTPLATVANLCDEALDEFGGSMPAGARELIEAAKQRTFRMSAMINELLATATTSEEDEVSELVETKSIFDEIIDRVRGEAEKKKIEIKLQTPLPTAWGNRVRLREAFYNLVANAVKFIDKRPGRIEIGAQANDGHALFVVTDNGPGIAQEEMGRIFSPFRRLPSHRDKPGSGLGLYFAKSLIEREGGNIWVESEVGKGSQFCVLLVRTPK